MVQVIFYAMVIDDAAELGLSCRLTMDCVMWAMQKLDWGLVEAWLGDIDRKLRRAQASQPANPTGGMTTSFPTFRDTTHVVECVRDNLCWSVWESSSLCLNLLPLQFEGLCPEFAHTVAMQFAHATRIPEMVQAIFYAMVISDAAELRLSSRDAMGNMMLELQELRWDIVEVWLLSIDERLRDAQIPRLVKMVYNPRPRPEVTSRLRDTPPLSSDEE